MAARRPHSVFASSEMALAKNDENFRKENLWDEQLMAKIICKGGPFDGKEGPDLTIDGAKLIIADENGHRSEHVYKREGDALIYQYSDEEMVPGQICAFSTKGVT
jgi:hypothetical protein